MSSRAAVSILVLNLNGRQHLDRCLGSLEQVRHSPGDVEVLLLDNGSTDDSVGHVRSRFPRVRVIELGRNLGYARGMNRGALEHAGGEVLVFLNNDTEVEPDFLTPLVAPVRDGRAAAAAAKIVSFDGGAIDFAAGGSNFHGIAFQDGMGEADGPSFSTGKPTLFPCGAAFAIRRQLFAQVGGFDEDFFAYYEDVDLGWRLWILGHEVLFVPESRVRHHHSATSLGIALHKVRVLHLRNPLLMLFKNYEEEHLRRVMPAAMLLSARRTWYLAGLDADEFRIGGEAVAPSGLGLFRRPRARREYVASLEMPKVAASDLVAVNDIVARFPGMAEKRRWIQERRRRPDLEILPLFLDPFRPAEANPEYARFQDEICRFFGIDEMFPAARFPLAR